MSRLWQGVLLGGGVDVWYAGRELAAGWLWLIPGIDINSGPADVKGPPRRGSWLRFVRKLGGKWRRLLQRCEW
jgi:hypothetical protein